MGMIMSEEEFKKSEEASIAQDDASEQENEAIQDESQSGKKKKHKRLSKKQAIIVSVVSVVIVIVIVLTCCFMLINELRFMSYSKEKMQANALVYQTRYNDGKVKFIAHRGLSVEAYQNTLDAFLLAGQDEHIYGIETDVWMTADDGMVCMHDRDSLQGIKNVNEVSLEVAMTTPIKSNPACYAPSIQQYLDVCNTYGKVAIIELKDDKMTNANLDRLLQIVAESGAQATYISFHFKLLDYIRSKDSEVELQLLSFKGVVGLINDVHLTYDQEMQLVIDRRMCLSCNYLFLAKDVAERFHKAGLKVGVWTLNDARSAICCAADFHADYITTDVRLYKDIEKYIDDLIE